MAKKFVRGITDIKTINNQDFDTNNVNDLLSDGEHNYIHRKKGKTEEYHNLTDNIKTISSDNTELLAVTNNNKTTNTATLHPKHDSQKEQSIESSRNTITVNRGGNGTSETTKVDTNPAKVLEHDNLLTGYGIEKSTYNGATTLTLKPTKVTNFNVNTYFKGKITGQDLTNAPTKGWYVYENDYYPFSSAICITQTATRLKLSDVSTNEKYMRVCDNGVWGEWIKQVTDEQVDKYPLALELFENIAVIGDSYSSGALFPTDGVAEYFYDISWINILARKHGLSATHYSRGGLQARTWLTSPYGLPKLQQDTPKDLYFIYLGINDNNILKDNEIGTINDVGTDNDTFYGNYSKIINNVKTKAPNAKIVVINMINGSKNKVYQPINKIAEHFNLPVLDLSKHNLTNSADFRNEMKDGHPQALGYASLAGAIEQLLSKSFNNDKSYWINYIPQSK